ncbi:MAG: CRISPR-associated protein Cas2 [Pseudomonadota bacterium]
MRTDALRVVRGHATGGQKSVHEVFLTDAEKRGLMSDMGATLAEEDNFLLLRLEPRTRVQVRGVGQGPADPDYFYMG